jgi:hypothetical protein
MVLGRSVGGAEAGVDGAPGDSSDWLHPHNIAPAARQTIASRILPDDFMATLLSSINANLARGPRKHNERTFRLWLRRKAYRR